MCLMRLARLLRSVQVRSIVMLAQLAHSVSFLTTYAPRLEYLKRECGLQTLNRDMYSVGSFGVPSAKLTVLESRIQFLPRLRVDTQLNLGRRKSSSERLSLMVCARWRRWELLLMHSCYSPPMASRLNSRQKLRKRRELPLIWERCRDKCRNTRISRGRGRHRSSRVGLLTTRSRQFAITPRTTFSSRRSRWCWGRMSISVGAISRANGSV